MNYHVVAKDFHSSVMRNEIWTNSLYLWPTMFSLPRAYIGIESQENRINYFLDLESFSQSREVFQKQIEEDRALLKRIIDLSDVFGAEMNAFTENLMQESLSSWSNERLGEFYKEFCHLQSRQYAVGILLPLIDLTGVSYIEVKLKEVLGKYLPSDEAARAFTTFTTPTKNSFSLDQEEDLLRLAEKIFADSACRSILQEFSSQQVLVQLQKSLPEFAKLLEDHVAKYAWVYYVYQGPAFEAPQFVEFLHDYFQKGVDPRAELQRRKDEREKLFAERDRLFAQISLSEQEKDAVLIASEFVWSKPRRKDYQSKSYYHLEKFFREFARRMNISLRHARAATQAQIADALKTGAIDPTQLERQYKYHIVGQGEDRAFVLSGKEAEEFSQNIIPSHEGAEDVQELHGSTAFPGLVRGTVKVVNVPEDMVKMNQGDILVAIATTPSCVPAMKKAAAIVSDEGGLTCHAAIVSRELKVPCVVGTKVATSVLKDGDEVEVDAEKGIVRKLS